MFARTNRLTDLRAGRSVLIASAAAFMVLLPIAFEFFTAGFGAPMWVGDGFAQPVRSRGNGGGGRGRGGEGMGAGVRRGGSQKP